MVAAYLRRKKDELLRSCKALFGTLDEDLLLMAFFRRAGVVRVPSVYAVRGVERTADLQGLSNTGSKKGQKELMEM